MTKIQISAKFKKNAYKELALAQKQHELIFNIGRQILQNAKQAIFFLQYDDMIQAEKSFSQTEVLLKKLKSIPVSVLEKEENYRAAVEELTEALLFKQAVKKQTLIPPVFIGCGVQQQLGGLADCTGELVRYAILKSAAGHYEWIVTAQEYTQAAVALMSPLYLTGKLRQKFDETKRNLQRLEQMLYEVRLRVIGNKK